jgi:hypothetical protein
MYECETDPEGIKFRINSFNKYSHQLAEVFNANMTSELLKKYSLAYINHEGIYSYDEYYNELSQELRDHNKSISCALHDLPDKWEYPILCIDGNFCEFPSVLYALQRNASNTISMKLETPLFQEEANKLKCWFPDKIKEQISTNLRITLLDCLKETRNVFVPLENRSLNSTFFQGVKWGDIIPNMNKDCTIAGVDCKCIILKVIVDGFQNIFCRATDLFGEYKEVWVSSVLNSPVEIGSPKLIKTEQVKSKEREIKIDKKSPLNKETQTTKSKRTVEEQNIVELPQNTTPSRKKGKTLEEVIEKLDIMKGETGHTYRSLFGKYLEGAQTVYLAEPYMVVPSQWDNLKDFIDLFVEVGQVKTFILETQRPEKVKIPDWYKQYSNNRQGFITQFNKKLKQIQKELRKLHVDFSWVLSDIHRRLLDIDNYHIDLDYGLDLYESQKGSILKGQTFRKCKENHIKVVKQIKS